ncbi:Dihydrolipoyllysine-residue succinyltransferase component of 2-oxoglutarate dehydrogenase complex [Bienertia sinuspersici]
MTFIDVNLNSNTSPCNKKKEDLEKRNEEFSIKCNENNNLLKTVVRFNLLMLLNPPWLWILNMH